VLEVAMKETFLAASLPVLLILLVVTQPAFAKAPTVKVTIEGGGLPSMIEVTNPQLLSSSNIWQGNFLNGSRHSVTERPGLLRYEVSFYVEFANHDVRKRYVVYYYPSPSKEQGYIYLPGKGETWHALNVRAILRTGQDGKWNYASPAWEELIKPIIALAEAAQHHGCWHETLRSGRRLCRTQ
jgi:hypothetical protein